MDWLKGSFSTEQGVKITYGKVMPKDLNKLKGIVIIVHGFAEHMGRYTDFASFLSNEEYGVYIMDHIGHGESGIKGFVEDFWHMVDSVNQLTVKAKAENPDKPIFMFGHSMGGLITLAYGIKYPDNLTGQVLSAPALDVGMAAGIKGFLKIAQGLIPKFSIKNPVSNLICKDKNVVEQYKNDPLVLHKASVALYYQVFIRGTQFVTANLNKCKYPYLILHGADDKIVSPSLSKEIYNKSSSQDKSIKIYEGLYHELLNEPEKQMVKDDILQWLQKKC